MEPYRTVVCAGLRRSGSPDRPTRATALVLAGGRSARFGADKLAHVVADRPLACYALDAVALVCREVIILAEPGDPELGPAWLESSSPDWRVVRDELPAAGPLVALCRGLGSARHTRCVVVGADMPLLAPGLLRRMLVVAGDRRAASKPLAVVLRLENEVQPLPFVISRAAAPMASSLIAAGGRSLRDLLGTVPVHVLEEDEWRPYDPTAATFYDVDSPNDLLALQAINTPGRPKRRRLQRRGCA